MRHFVSGCLLLLATIWPASVMADQNDSRLDGLFGALRAATSPQEASTFEGQIWALWLKNDSPTVNLLMHRALVAMNDGRLDESLAVLDEMVVLAPDFAEAWNKRATVLYMMRRFEESLHDVDRTLELEPRHFGALSGMGLIYDAIGDDAKALAAFERALAVNPHIPLAESEVKRLSKKVHGEKI